MHRLAQTRALSLTGLILLTWKVGWTLNDPDRRKQTDTGLLTFDMGKPQSQLSGIPFWMPPPQSQTAVGGLGQ